VKKKEPITRAPCNITKNNTIELVPNLRKNAVTPFRIDCVRFKCGKIKWKRKNDKNR
jgi:hypothetical protein